MDSARAARLIGAGFGLVFVLVNAGVLATGWSWLVRLAGIALCLVVLVRLASAPESRLRPRPEAVRVYWASVVAEVVAIVVGVRLLAAHGLGDYGVVLVAAVVGVHFVPFAWAFSAPEFGWLGGVLIGLALLAAVLGLAGTGSTAAVLVAGVGSGLALLGYAAGTLEVLRERGSA